MTTKILLAVIIAGGIYVSYRYATGKPIFPGAKPPAPPITGSPPLPGGRVIS